MSERDYKNRRNIILSLIIFSIICSLPFFNWRKKTIDKLGHFTGIIKSKQIIEGKFRDKNSYTFIFTLDGLNQNLGIFLGASDAAIKEGNFYDSLFEINHPISVYYDNNVITKYENITRLIYKIDYNGQTIINRGAPRGWIISLFFLFPVPILIFFLFTLRRKFDKQQLSNKI